MDTVIADRPFVLLRHRRRSFRLWLVEWLSRVRRRPVADPRPTNLGSSLPGPHVK